MKNKLLNVARAPAVECSALLGVWWLSMHIKKAQIVHFRRVFFLKLRHFLRVKFFIACYLLAKFRLNLRYRLHLLAYEFNVPSYSRWVCSVEDKLVNSVKMICQFHKRVKPPNAKVSDGSQPPLKFDFDHPREGWLPFAAPPCWPIFPASCNRLSINCRCRMNSS